MKTIIKDRNIIDELERLQYDTFTRKSIIAYMIDSDFNIESDNFQKYQKAYFQVLKEYEDKKDEIELLYVKSIVPNAKSWNLDFKTGELIID